MTENKNRTKTKKIALIVVAIIVVGIILASVLPEFI